MLRNAVGGGWLSNFTEKTSVGVRFNVISITSGRVSDFQKKKRYVTLERLLTQTVVL